MNYDKDTIVFEPIPANPRFIDLQDRTFGRWTVLGYMGRSRWYCECVCGTIKPVASHSLRAGSSTSCGCFHAERVGSMFTKHGMSNSPEYRAYSHAKGRCETISDTRYHVYGARGIEFRFTSFNQFFAEIGPRPSPEHSLDRRNNNGHYEPGNVQWATETKQQRNRRNNRLLTVDGVTRCQQEWASVMSIKRGRIEGRSNRGWCDACAVTLPVGSSCVHKS